MSQKQKRQNFIQIFVLFLITLFLFMSGPARAAEPKKMESVVSYFSFEHKGHSSSETFTINGAEYEIPIQATWFDWKCTAYRQIDGTSVRCQRGEDSTEIKVFCRENNFYAARAMKVGKGVNFVTIEISCIKPKPVTTAKAKKPAPTKKKAEKPGLAPQPTPEQQEALKALPTPATPSADTDSESAPAPSNEIPAVVPDPSAGAEPAPMPIPEETPAPTPATPPTAPAASPSNGNAAPPVAPNAPATAVPAAPAAKTK